MRKRLLRLAGTPLLLTTASFAAVVVPGAVMGGAHTPEAAHASEHRGTPSACHPSTGDGVKVDYRTGYDAGSGQYVVTGVDLSGLPSCTGRVDVTLLGARGEKLGDGSVRLTSAGGALTVPVGKPVSAEQAARVSVVVEG